MSCTIAIILPDSRALLASYNVDKTMISLPAEIIRIEEYGGPLALTPWPSTVSSRNDVYPVPTNLLTFEPDDAAKEAYLEFVVDMKNVKQVSDLH